MKPLESWVEKKFVDQVKKDFGARVVKFRDAAQVGAPDRLVLLTGGKVVFIELKREGKTARKSQLRYIDTLLSLGFVVHICDNWKDAYEAVRRVV